MKFSRRLLLLAFAVPLLPLEVVAAPADYPAARRFIQQHHDALLASMKRSSNPKENPELLRLFDEMLDYDHFVRESLGTSWETLSEEQRRRFSEILRGLIRGSYRKNLRDLTGYDIAYTGESDANGGVLVATLASDPKKKRQEALRLDYVVGKVDARHKVRDIVTAGVSLVQNYRKQFARIIKKEGADGLLQKMQTQLDRLESDGS
jgi:phospholipid transport system substrate-binding protein